MKTGGLMPGKFPITKSIKYLYTILRREKGNDV